MAKSSLGVVAKAEELTRGNDASNDAWHVLRVRNFALSLARDERLSSDPDSMGIVELAALLHDIGDYKYLRDPSEEELVLRTSLSNKESRKVIRLRY